MKFEVPVDVVSAVSQSQPQFLVRDVERSPWAVDAHCRQFMETRVVVPKMGVRSFDAPFVRSKIGRSESASVVFAEMAAENRRLMSVQWNSAWGREARQARKVSGSSSASSVP